ncbi:MAG: hypothetical protein ACKVJG_25415 [Candidatus Latescibacterota bacterium]
MKIVAVGPDISAGTGDGIGLLLRIVLAGSRLIYRSDIRLAFELTKGILA